MTMAAPGGTGDSMAARGEIGRGSGDMRVRLDRNPLRLAVSASPWRSAWYLISYLLVSWVLFSIAFSAGVTAAVFAITIAGIPLLTAAAVAIRGCANVERQRLRQVLSEPVRGEYRAVTRPGVIAQATTHWRDRATWRDLAYLVGLWVPLTALDTIVLSVWATFLAGITLPVWYWAPRGAAGVGYVNDTQVHGVALGYFPHGPHGRGAEGLYVDTLPRALLAAAVFLVLFLLFNYVLVATARAQARATRSLLRAPADPLAAAKNVLARPGPLGAHARQIPNGSPPASHTS
jgi:Putative sensor